MRFLSQILNLKSILGIKTKTTNRIKTIKGQKIEFHSIQKKTNRYF
jgi:hypothetical protein